ncbi:MAG TPA: HlyD family type I secretion periplasmic adaptor subunit, partial [Burkholderiaceae bacterium]|nr:HlyD family type I secretion periplasmic adaptor subunit [Burkholderiaceae bacterium]
LAANQRSVVLIERELHVAEDMAGQGLLSEVEVMRLQRQLNEQRLQGQERLNRFRQDASTELLRQRADLAQLLQQQQGRADTLRRTVLASPVDGVVKSIRVSTVGGVVGPGATVMEVVPSAAQLLVEARVKPSDVGFLRPGQKAELRLSAYDPGLYGSLHGRVDHISPDVLGDADRPAATDASYYRVLVRTDDSVMRHDGQQLTVIPGMTGTVDIRTGERSVLSFLLRPLLRSREAFRER